MTGLLLLSQRYKYFIVHFLISNAPVTQVLKILVFLTSALELFRFNAHIVSNNILIGTNGSFEEDVNARSL